MKYLLIILVILINSCSLPAQKAGYYDPKNKSEKPYLFIYNDTIENAFRSLKRIVIINGFSIANEDIDAGILVTYPKSLKEDETLHAGSGSILNAMGGIQIKEEKAIVSFIFDLTENNNVIISMRCTLSSKETVNTELFGRRDTNRERILMQGEPLPMKLKSKLIESNNFQLYKR